MQNLADAVYDHLPVLRRFARRHTITIEAADYPLLQALERLHSRWISRRQSRDQARNVAKHPWFGKRSEESGRIP